MVTPQGKEGKTLRSPRLRIARSAVAGRVEHHSARTACRLNAASARFAGKRRWRRIAANGPCAKLAGKRRSRRTGDPETATPWTPSLQFAPLEGGQDANLRRSSGHRAPIQVARE